MRSRLEDDLCAPTPGAFHCNVRYKPDQIEWVWIVEAKRYATPKEIADLCKGKALKGSGSV